ncbi:hypothetical protein PIB30_089503, partial [Stylosanthes scabra]|nr:hypothetical protein [Stylosanthes scabra]
GKRSCLLRVRSSQGNDDVDVETTAELGTIKFLRYHSNNEKFTQSVLSKRFDPNRPYEFPIAMLGRGEQSVQTYSPCRRRIYRAPAKSFLTPKYSPLSKSWMGRGDVEMNECEEKGESEPEEEKEKSKETSDTQPMSASIKSKFLKFLTTRQQPMCSSSGSSPSINSRNPSHTSGFSSSTRSFHSSHLSRVWSSSSAPSQ